MDQSINVHVQDLGSGHQEELHHSLSLLGAGLRRVQVVGAQDAVSVHERHTEVLATRDQATVGMERGRNSDETEWGESGEQRGDGARRQ